jgi:hypothetical protein
VGYGKSVPSLSSQLPSGQKRFSQTPFFSADSIPSAGIEIRPSALTHEASGQKTSSQTPFFASVSTDCFFSAGKAAISSSLRTRASGKKM